MIGNIVHDSKNGATYDLNDYFDSNTHIATEENFRKFLSLRLYTDNVIGYHVQLPNVGAYNGGNWLDKNWNTLTDTTSILWTIVDVNHDKNNTNQANCYDLLCENRYRTNTTWGGSGISYRNSYIRPIINSIYYGFEIIKGNIIKPRHLINGTWYNDDYVILLSGKECGYSSYSEIPTNEGVSYPSVRNNLGYTRTINPYNNWVIYSGNGYSSSSPNDSIVDATPLIRVTS